MGFNLIKFALGELHAIEDAFRVVQLLIGQETIFYTPFGGEELCDVVSDGITKNTNYSFALVIFPSYFLDKP